MRSFFRHNFAGYTLLEQLGETNHSFIYRAGKMGYEGTVILKVVNGLSPSTERIARFKRENEIIRGLDMDGVVRPIDFFESEGVPVIVLEDFGGVSLKTIIAGGMGIERFLSLAVRLADILGGLHQANISHCDIKPSNILINPDSNVIKITDFGISELVQVDEKATHSAIVEGTLAYISPEQTGRLNCGVDYRTDLYSLGVSFYEMLTGTVPFQSMATMDIIHAHIAKQAMPPSEYNAAIPGPLSDIIMKLMAKSAEDRYQNSFGLAADLRNCLQQWQSIGYIEPFCLGEQDISMRFILPQRVVGRTEECDFLQTAFEQCCRGATQIVLVTGEPGIGKTALVNEMQQLVTAKRGFFISGKFDQFQNAKPYSAIIRAFQGLTRQLLAESDEHLQQWKKKLLSAFGSNGKVITDVIPEIELIIGKQPRISVLGAEEAQNRFNLLFGMFVRVFAAQNHPLVLFLDDLQWADSASLHMIQTIAKDGNLQYFLCIGAYRGQGVDENHPLLHVRDTIHSIDMPVHVLPLSPLESEDINGMIAPFLVCAPEVSSPLARLIHSKTKGNPFFVHQFLKRLYDKAFIVLDPTKGWIWDLSQIEQMQATDNVVPFLVDKLQDLPLETLYVLQLFACIGSDFDLERVVALTGRSLENLLSIMDELIQNGLISRFVDRYRFYHNRIQEAAYSLLSIPQREEIHHKIGKLELSKTPADQRAERIFYICDQLNQAGACIKGSVERTLLAELNLEAGIRAKKSTAYSAAIDYLEKGRLLLNPDVWQGQYSLAYRLHIELMECRYLNQDLGAAEHLFDIIVANAATMEDKAKAYNIMIVLYTATRAPAEAIRFGLEALMIFGIKLDIDVGKGPVFVELIKTRWRIKRVGLENVLDLPVLQDDTLRVIIELIVSVGTPAYYINQNLFALISLKGLNLALKHGLTQYTSMGLIVLANIIQGAFGDYNLSFRIGRMALQLNDKFGDQKIDGMVQHLYAVFIHHWKRPLKEGVEHYYRVIQQSMNSGNFVYVGYSLGSIVYSRLLLGHRLDDVLEELTPYKDLVTQLKDPFFVNQYHHYTQTILALKGLTPLPYDLSMPGFDQDEQVKQLRQSGNYFGLSLVLYDKMLFLSRYRFFEAAQKVAVDLGNYIKIATGTILEPYYYFHITLIIIALLKQGGQRPGPLRTRIRRYRRKISKWADVCPENFRHMDLLISAEMAALHGHSEKAMTLYHHSIHDARRNGFLPNEALALELIGEFYFTRHYLDEAGLALRRACKAYHLWGAWAKVDDLKQRYPNLIPAEKRSGSMEYTTSTTQEFNSHNLDLSTVMEVSQIISGEIMLDRLLSKTMHMSIANAGAQRGFLILETQGRLSVQASEDVETGAKEVLQNLPVDQSHDLSAAIVNYVCHSREPVILNNAMQEGAFVNDPYVVSHRCKSILCLPILNSGKLAGILYMENNLTSEVFTPQHLEILNLISAQAAISIQNARLYKDITTEIAFREEVQERMRSSEEKYRTILEEMQDAYCETDFSGFLTFHNPFMANITGYTDTELMGSIFNQLIPAAEQDGVAAYFYDIRVAGKPGKPYNCNFTCKSGHQVPMEMVASLIRDKYTKPVGYRIVSRDVSERKRLENDLLESGRYVQAARMATILGLAKLSEYRDVDTGTHLERIREYARVIASELATHSKYKTYITQEYIEDIYNSAILHDIGKVGVPDAILQKPSKLTPEEFEIIKTHTTLGGDALRDVEVNIEGQTFLTLSKEIAYHHHEWWDGTGYPKGLKGDNIPLSARIVALADVYDALTSQRPYKEAYSHDKAVQIIVSERGTHFAPDVVDAFLAHEETFRRIRELAQKVNDQEPGVRVY